MTTSVRQKSEFLSPVIIPAVELNGVSARSNDLKEKIDLITNESEADRKPTTPKENSTGAPSTTRTTWAFQNELGNKAWEVIA